MSGNLPVQRSCPNCQGHFLNSSLLERNDNLLRLKCENCNNEYSLTNSINQQRHLTRQYGTPSQIIQLLNIEQLRVGDAISFKRYRSGIKYQHHAIVVGIDLNEETVDLVEFAPDKPARQLKDCIFRNRNRFRQDIATQNAWLRQYMPLDCLPRSEVVQKANRFIDEPESQPTYFLTEFNCQHLTSLCKTGKSISEEADEINNVSFRLMNGIRVASLLSRPGMTYGICGVDSIVRLSKVFITKLNQIEKGVADPDILRNDVGQLLINALSFGAQKSGLMARIWTTLSSQVFRVVYFVTAVYLTKAAVDFVDFLWRKVEDKMPSAVKVPVNCVLGVTKNTVDVVHGCTEWAVNTVTNAVRWAVDKYVPNCVKNCTSKAYDQIVDAGVEVVTVVCKGAKSIASSVGGFFRRLFC